MKRHFQNKKVIPKSIQNRTGWTLSRKHFVKSLIASGIITQIPIGSLVAQNEKSKSEILTKEQSEIIESIQEILFPIDENGPGAKEINARNYLDWVLSDNEMDQAEINYIIDGIGWVNETSEEVYAKQFVELTQSEQEQLVKKISQGGWGESWLSIILTFVFEALLCDPKYGGNPNNIGWNWLSHSPGQPRPTNDLLYPEILSTVDKT